LQSLRGEFCASAPHPVPRPLCGRTVLRRAIGQRRTAHRLRFYVNVSRWFSILRLWWKLWGVGRGSGGNWRASQHPPMSSYPLLMRTDKQSMVSRGNSWNTTTLPSYKQDVGGSSPSLLWKTNFGDAQEFNVGTPCCGSTVFHPGVIVAWF
jgi:hypothetical protein